MLKRNKPPEEQYLAQMERRRATARAIVELTKPKRHQQEILVPLNNNGQISFADLQDLREHVFTEFGKKAPAREGGYICFPAEEVRYIAGSRGLPSVKAALMQEENEYDKQQALKASLREQSDAATQAIRPNPQLLYGNKADYRRRLPKTESGRQQEHYRQNHPKQIQGNLNHDKIQ